MLGLLCGVVWVNQAMAPPLLLRPLVQLGPRVCAVERALPKLPPSHAQLLLYKSQGALLLRLNNYLELGPIKLGGVRPVKF